MKQIVTCREMKALDGNTIEGMGVPSCVLMERAALKVVEEIEKVLDSYKDKEKILCVCGSGNNGGDGVAIARILKLHGYQTFLYLLGNPAHRTEEMLRQLDIAANYQVPVVNELKKDEYTTVVDAIFGVGLSRPIEGVYKTVIEELNQMKAWKVAVDIPSGVNGDTGAELGIAFRADLTVTFAFRKAGLCLYPGRKLAGKVVVADVGIYESESIQAHLWQIERSDLSLLLDKAPDGNKGTFGKVLIVAGSPGMCGAAYLSASGAFAAGAGMVKVVTSEKNRIPMQTMLPEAMLDCGDDYERSFNWGDVLVIGPGLGMSEEAGIKAEWFLRAAFEEDKPVVLDADGLNLLAQHPEWNKYLTDKVILTPHIGEMSRLTSKPVSKIQSDRITAARELASETGAVCVLKDACTVAAAPDGNAWISLEGNPGMATAGSGDVLSGVLAGVQAMFLKTATSDKCTRHSGIRAALGVLLHGMAGDRAAAKIGMAGMKASDIAHGAAEVMKDKENTALNGKLR